ncbi:dihydropteroate synthase [Corynebacterium sp. TAE3-ERU30]|uniref:dihydropteroate synthase n=1 Tax=Corynebacterium sp. TAE3-ERU30 TaxID=2849496 RepID=UPI001C45ADD2|nr:dihydropteroate synthase [Corynebacterium sp. TAE3-ERU30]MBV7281574.1 dihydropteroate synthase [Corynebacterium sp. TAE3-ERU30]
MPALSPAFRPGPLPAVMAIINRTPDSFYDQGATFSDDAALARIDRVVGEGATILDIGGVKAGPGEFVSAAEEVDRVVPIIAAAHERHPEIAISVDTWRTEVARAAVEAGASLINDTWAGVDSELVELAGEKKVGYVCSHTGGQQPRTRPHRVRYDDVVAAVIAETSALAERAVACGVPENKVLIDPTHDFGKNTYHGLELLRRIDEVVATGWPVLMALSNKDFVGETTGRAVDKRVAGTLAATAHAAAHGVAAFRVHQVSDTVDVCRMVAAISGDMAPVRAQRGLI